MAGSASTPEPFVSLQPSWDSEVTAITTVPTYHRTTYIYAYPALHHLDPNVRATFYFLYLSMRRYPLAATMLGSILSLTWELDMRNRVMYHEPGPPFVWNNVGGVLLPFVLPVPYNA